MPSTSLIHRSLFALLLTVALTCPWSVLEGARPTRQSPSPSAVWVFGPSLPTAVWALGAGVDNAGRVYAIGGNEYNASEGFYDTYYGVFQLPLSGQSWSQVASLERSYFGVTSSPGGGLYAIGGCYMSALGPLPFQWGTYNDVQQYNPPPNSWTEAISTLPLYGSNFATASLADGRVFVIGGAAVDVCSSDSVGITTPASGTYVYTPATGQWTAIASMPTARYGAAAAVGPDGRIYVAGGENGAVEYGQFLAAFEVYDPTSDTWTEAAPLPTARTGLALVLGNDGRLYAIGGYSTTTADGYSCEVDAYDPRTDSWASVPNLNVCRGDLAAVTDSKGVIYAMGGRGAPTSQNVTGILNTVELFNTSPPTPTETPSRTPSPSPTAALDPTTTASMTASVTPSPTATVTAFPTPTATLATQPTLSATVTAGLSSTLTFTATATPTLTPAKGRSAVSVYLPFIRS